MLPQTWTLQQMPNIQQVMEALDGYAKICHKSNKIDIPTSLSFAAGFSQNTIAAMLDTYDITLSQLDKKYTKYFIDMIASITTNENLKGMREMTQEPISQATLIAEFKQVKLALVNNPPAPMSPQTSDTVIINYGSTCQCFCCNSNRNN